MYILYVHNYYDIHTHTHRETYIFVCKRETFILKDWLMQFWGLAHLKSAGQANRLKSQGRADNVISSSKTLWRQNSFSLGNLHFFPLKAFN